MGGFVASNGIQVVGDRTGRVVVTRFGTNRADFKVHDASESEALREFFRAEERGERSAPRAKEGR